MFRKNITSWYELLIPQSTVISSKNSIISDETEFEISPEGFQDQLVPRNSSVSETEENVKLQWHERSRNVASSDMYLDVPSKDFINRQVGEEIVVDLSFSLFGISRGRTFDVRSPPVFTLTIDPDYWKTLVVPAVTNFKTTSSWQEIAVRYVVKVIKDLPPPPRFVVNVSYVNTDVANGWVGLSHMMIYTLSLWRIRQGLPVLEEDFEDFGLDWLYRTTADIISVSAENDDYEIIS